MGDWRKRTLQAFRERPRASVGLGTDSALAANRSTWDQRLVEMQRCTGDLPFNREIEVMLKLSYFVV